MELAVSSLCAAPVPVSVCIPTYNRAHYLQGAIESVLTQTYHEFEIIVSDNASTDGTEALVRSFRDLRIRYLRNERNVGGPANWVRAVSAASGTYCVIIGDDDRWEPTFLERLTAPLDQHPDVDVAFSDHWIVDADGRVQAGVSDAYSTAYGRATLPPGKHCPFVDLAIRMQALLTTAALIRRERMLAVGALDARAGLVLDYYLFAQLALAGGGAFYVPERLAHYRVHAQGASATQQARLWQDMEWVCAELIGSVPSPRHVKEIRRRWAGALASKGSSLLRDGRRWQAVGAFGESIRLSPVALRPWLGLAAALRLGFRPTLRQRAAG